MVAPCSAAEGHPRRVSSASAVTLQQDPPQDLGLALPFLKTTGGKEPSAGPPAGVRRVSGVAPFLKTTGGKGRLLGELEKHVPESFGRYHEPFVGGGALFFALAG